MSQETGQHRPHACKHVANVKFPLNVTCSASEPRNTLFRHRRDTQLPNPLTAQPRGPDFNGIHVPCPPPPPVVSPRRVPTAATGGGLGWGESRCGPCLAAQRTTGAERSKSSLRNAWLPELRPDLRPPFAGLSGLSQASGARPALFLGENGLPIVVECGDIDFTF